ncbi:MAG: head GIN domain-containing protein [Bacteroidota bacterium]
MKKIIAGFIMVSTVFFASAQKTIVNDANAEKRNVPGFSGISVSGGIDIYLTQGNEDGIAVSAAETKYRDRIKTEVKNGLLTIWYDNQGISWSNGNKKLRAYISFKNINQLHASGSSDVYISGVLKASDLTIRLAGSSDLKGVVDIENLKTDMSGASDITISGKVGSLNIDASGSSDFKDYDLVAQNCDAHVSGSSDVQITVEKELNASASGSSDIHIKGNGIIKKMSTSGSSSIKKG